MKAKQNKNKADLQPPGAKCYLPLACSPCLSLCSIHAHNQVILAGEAALNPVCSPPHPPGSQEVEEPDVFLEDNTGSRERTVEQGAFQGLLSAFSGPFLVSSQPHCEGT